MCRCKIVVRILLIVSVFNFVLAAPAAVRDVRKAWADGVDGGEDVITTLGKRAKQPEGDLYPPYPSWLEPGSESESGSLLRGSQGSSSRPNFDLPPHYDFSGPLSGPLRGSQHQGSLSRPNFDLPPHYDSSGPLRGSQHQGSSSGPNFDLPPHYDSSGPLRGSQYQGDLYPSPPQQDSGSGSGSDSSLLRGSQHRGDLYPPSPPQQDSGSGSDSDSSLRGSQHQGIQQEDHPYHSLAQQGSPSDSESEWSRLLKDSQHQGSSSGLNYAGGTHPGIQQGGNSYYHSPDSGSDSDSGSTRWSEVPPASSKNTKSVSWAPPKMIPLSPPPSPPPEPSLPLPPQAGTAAQKPPSKGFFNKLLKLKFRPRFWRRISGTAGGGAVLTLARVGG